MLKGTSVALAGALGLALLAGPSAAQNQDTIKLSVPVQLKSMLAAKVYLICEILRGTEKLGATGSGNYDIVNGEFDQVIEVDVKAAPGRSFLSADSYSCDLHLISSATNGWKGTPYQGTPSGKADVDSLTLFKLAKPGAFFRVHAQGPLHGGKIVDGVVGPGKDLTIGPKPKQP